MSRTLAVGLFSALVFGCGEDTTARAPVNAGVGGAAAANAGASSGGSKQTSGGVGGNSGSSGSGNSNIGNAGSAGKGLGGANAGAGGASEPPLIADCDNAAAHERADRALDALLGKFWNETERYMNETSPSNGKVTGYWTYAQALDAVLDGFERTGNAKYEQWISTFYAGRDKRGWIVDFFDDEAWMTLALVRAYDLTGDVKYLDRAELIFQDIMKAWDTSCCGAHLGGIWWNRKHEQKATASNAGPVIAGARLAKRTKKDEYLTFAKTTYAFWMTHMVDSKTYSIFDHLSPDGSRALGALSYNHGLMIGAALELHAAYGEEHYLTEAHGFGRYMVTHATRPSDVGPLIYDSIAGVCDGDCPAWKGIGYRYLAVLFRKDPTRKEYRDVLEAGVEGIWTMAREPVNNFFATNWSGPPPSVGGVEEQSSATMALNIFATLCGPPP
jgi:predicted alpha-1,6-mannanase (GH76 family)